MFIRTIAGAVLTGLVILVLSLAATVSSEQSSSFFQFSLSLSAGTARKFFMVTGLALAAQLIGRILAQPYGRRLTILGIRPDSKLRGIMPAADSVVFHFLTWTIAGAMVMLVLGNHGFLRARWDRATKTGRHTPCQEWPGHPTTT